MGGFERLRVVWLVRYRLVEMGQILIDESVVIRKSGLIL